MKIICTWCNGSKHCHIVNQNIKDYHSEHGIDRVTISRVKIHKHHKGKTPCKGSERMITICLEDQEYHKGYEA